MNRQCIGLLFVSLGLAGCATAPLGNSGVGLPADNQAGLGRQPQQGQPTADSNPSGLGLAQAPTPQQVIESFPEGRVDPFGAIPVPVASNGPQSQRPTPDQIRKTLAKLQVLGFVKISGRQAVFVQHDNQSGEVYLGQVGGQSTEYLPDGWKLVAVEGSLGRIALARQDLKVFLKI